MYIPFKARWMTLSFTRSEINSLSNCALCGAQHNAHYAEPGIMRSWPTEISQF